jgi:hypothetical protein
MLNNGQVFGLGMKLLQLLKLLKLIFLSVGNKEVELKKILRKFAILGKVWHFAPPIPFFIGPQNSHSSQNLLSGTSYQQRCAVIERQPSFSLYPARLPSPS